MGEYSEAEKPRVEGRLDLRFSLDEGTQQTQLIVQEQRPPLQVIRAFPIANGGALVHVHNISGGVLGGDQLEMEVEVEAGARAQLTSTGATRVYRARPGSADSQQTGTFKVGKDALLEYLPDPLIPFADSRYRQQMRIELDDNAGLFWWETVTPGRVAKGERFAYTQLGLDLRIAAKGRLIAYERLTLEPHRRAPSSLARLGPYTYFCSFYVCRVGREPALWSKLEKELGALAQELSSPGNIIWGVSSLVVDGLVIRALSCQERDIPPGLLAFWRAAKRSLYGEEPVPPRKIY